MPHPRRSVALLIDSSTSWGSSLMKGAALYAERHGPWALYLGQYGKHERRTLPVGVALDGCLARVNRRELADELVASGVPTVDVSWYRHGAGRIAVCTADGRLAAEQARRFLLDQGHAWFGYYGPPADPAYDNRCREAFLGAVAQAGGRCAVFDADRPLAIGDWPARRAALATWLAALPHPVAVLTFDAAYGREATEACAAAGVKVPDEVAVLSGEYDELFAALSVPRLSGLDLGADEIGYQAAALLDRIMAGEPPPTDAVLLPPRGVVAAASTDALAFGDPVVREAVRYIRARVGEPLQVDAVAAHVAVSRRSLEQRFRAALRRSPAAEIRRVRLARACELLADPALSIRAVAARSGFEHAEVFARVFRQAFGLSPSAYRLQARR